MLFNSLQFLFFFIVVTLAYYSLSWRGRWMLLLAASCYFYMVFKPVYILILFGTIVIDYIAGIWIERAEDPRKRKLLLIISLISNVGILAFFKYFDFLADSINDFFRLAPAGPQGTAAGRADSATHRRVGHERVGQGTTADRTVVPHVSGDELHHRGVPPQPEGRAPLSGSTRFT